MKNKNIRKCILALCLTATLVVPPENPVYAAKNTAENTTEETDGNADTVQEDAG